jgi:hypothetical protein
LRGLKYLEPVVFLIWMFLNTRTGQFFDSDFFFQIPETGSSLKNQITAQH